MPIIQVPGEVASSIATQTGKGLVKFWEKTHFNGKEKYVLWTAWFDLPQLYLGEHDAITISGLLSTKKGSYTKDGEERVVVEHHLNDCQIEKHSPNTRTSQDVQEAAAFMLEDTPF